MYSQLAQRLVAGINIGPGIDNRDLRLVQINAAIAAPVHEPPIVALDYIVWIAAVTWHAISSHCQQIGYIH